MASEEPAGTPTSAVLMALSRHIASTCAKQNKEYTACKKSDANPQTCLGPGHDVTSCVVKVLKEANETAPEELKAFYQCMDYYSHNFLKCRTEQEAFLKAFPPKP